MVRVSRGVAVLFLGLCAHACLEEPQACTDIGCSDSTGFTLHPPGDIWLDGSYALAVSFDDATYACAPFSSPSRSSFSIPEGVTVPIDCTPALDASLDQVVICETHSDGNSSSHTCTPIPGRYYLSVQTPTLAESLSVYLTRDGEPYFEKAMPLSYTLSQPNGPSCEPTCRTATVEFGIEQYL